MASALDVSAEAIKTSLESVTPVAGRMAPLPGLNGSTLYDDSYNANPLSVIAAAEFLASLGGESWLVLADMLELGDDAERIHHDVGEAIRESGVNRLFTLGELSAWSCEAFGDGASAYTSPDALVNAVTAGLNETVNLLVKGSRGMRMERVVDAVREVEPMRKGA